MPIDFDALRTGASTTELPTDGEHLARLERADFVETRSGERLVTEWTTADELVECSWTSWNRFDDMGRNFTRDLLVNLGLDLEAINTEVELVRALKRCTGQLYKVTTKLWGDNNDQVNTYCNGRAMVPVDGDISPDTGGLPEVPLQRDQAQEGQVDVEAAHNPNVPPVGAEVPPWEDDKVPF